MGRWMKHYLDIYSTENTVSGEALDSIQSTPVIQELDAEPTTEELEKVTMRPPEVIREGKLALLHELSQFRW